MKSRVCGAFAAGQFATKKSQKLSWYIEGRDCGEVPQRQPLTGQVKVEGEGEQWKSKSCALCAYEKQDYPPFTFTSHLHLFLLRKENSNGDEDDEHRGQGR